MNHYTKNKIYLVFAGIAGFFLLFALLLLNQGLTIKQFSDRIETKWLDRIVTVSAIDIATKSYRTNVALQATSTDAAEKDQYEQILLQLEDDIKAAQAKYEPTITTDKGRLLYEKFVKSLDNYLPASKEAQIASRGTDKEIMMAKLKAAGNFFNILNEEVQKLIDYNANGSTEDVQNGKTAFAQAKTWLRINASRVVCANVPIE